MRRAVWGLLVGLAACGGCGGPKDAGDARAIAREAGADAAPPVWRDAVAPGPPAKLPGPDLDAWQSQVLYLVLPDRFANGDPANDDAGQPGCWDPAGPTLFHGGDLAGLRARLGYVRELGASAIWTTPLYAQAPRLGASCGYHGYWADFAAPDDGAYEPKLGGRAASDALLAEMRASGLRYVLDMVVNHSAKNARIAAQKPAWFHDPKTCSTLGDGEIHCPLSGLPDFAQENAEVAAYLDAQSRGWVERVRPDAIRMDTAKHVPPSYFSSWIPKMREVRPDLFLIAEDLFEGPYDHFLRQYVAGFDSVFNFPLRRALIDAFAKGGSVDAVARSMEEAIKVLGPDRTRTMVTLLDNHDTPRFLSEADGGAAVDAAARYRLAMTALFTLPGIPQLYYGDELAMVGTYPDNRRDMPAWAWDPGARAGARAGYAGDPRETFDLVQGLVRLRGSEVALQRGSYVELWRQNGGPNVLAFYRAAESSRVLVVIHNATGSSGPVQLPFATRQDVAAADRAAWPEGAVLEDVAGRGAPKTLTVTGGRITVSLDGKVAGVYRKRR